MATKNTEIKKMKPIKPYIKKDHFRVAIFGSARIKYNDPLYRQIYQLAKLIAREDMDVVTGGGPGLMDAASRGHHTGRKNHDVTAYGLMIHLPKEQKEGFHIDIKKEFWRFSERLDNFMQLSHAVVVAPGGVGTLLEFLFAWQLVQVHHIRKVPIILLGDMWPQLLQWIKRWPAKNGFISAQEVELIYLANDITQALDILKNEQQQYLADKKNLKAAKNKYLTIKSRTLRKL